MSSQDHQRVDPSDEASLAHWAEKWGTTAQQLEEAVKAVGQSPDAVKEHLMNQGSSAGPS